MGAALARTLFNKALKSVVKDVRNVKNAASKIDTKSRMGAKGAPSYKSGVGEKEFKKSLENFSDLYKKSDAVQFTAFKKSVDEIDPNIWSSFKKNSKKRKLLNNQDTSRAERLRSGTSYPQNYAKPRTLKDRRRNVILDAWNRMTQLQKKNKTGLPLFPRHPEGGGPFGNPSTNPMLQRMQKNWDKDSAFPFENIGSTKTNRLIRTLRNKSPARPSFGYQGHSALVRPKYAQDLNSNQAEAYVRKLLPNYIGPVKKVPGEIKLGSDTVAGQYIAELWRSRKGFRTGIHSQDAENFLDFLRRQDFLNPRSSKYFKLQPEYENYLLTRKAQPKGQDLAHDVATLNPEGISDTMPFSGGEIGKTQFLDPNINLKTQGNLESEGLKSLLSNKKDLAKIDKDMMDQNIRTTLVNRDEMLTDEELLKFYLNRDKIKQEFGVDIEDYLSEGYYPMGGWKDIGFNEGGMVNGYAGGGLIKKGIEKLLKSTAFNQSRRKFLKQAGATAAYTALPTKTLAALAPKAASKAAARFAPPWIKSMMGVFDQLGSGKGYIMEHTMANGTKIKTLGGTADDYRGKMTPFEVTNSDGYKVPVNVFKDKKGNIDIEFDIRDDFANNQHIYMDKKTGTVEIVDENYHMTSPDDYAKDDPLTWDVTTPTQMQEFEKKMGIMKGDGSNKMKDFASTPEDGSYSDLFESFIDSFSPSGNIFNTKAKAQELIKKKIAKQEMMEMDWESQFRGGNIHGYRHGGSVTSRMDAGGRSPAGARALQERGYFDKPSTIRPRPKPPMPSNNISNIQPRIKPEVGGGYDWNKMMDAIGMVETNPAYMKANNLGPRHLYKSDEGAYGTYGLLRENFEGGLPMQRDDNSNYQHDRLAGTGFGVKRWKDFENTWKDEALQRQYATDFLKGMYNEFKANPDSKVHGQDALYEAITRYGDQKDKDYYNKVMGFYNQSGMNKGGMAEKFSVDDAVAMIRANPQSFVGGGLVKKFAPKVLGKLTNFKPRIAGPDLARVRTDLYTPPKGPYIIADESGVRTIDMEYKTLSEAQASLKALSELRTQDASTFKIFGARPPKTAEGVSKGAPEVDLGMVGKEIPPEQPGAMFWASREKIIDSPMETMTGQQWLDYLKRPTRNFNPIKDMELNDTSLSTFLSRNSKKPMAKEQLVKDFDNTLAPQLDVTVLGEHGTKDLRSLERKLQKIDLQGFRPGPVRNTLGGLKNNLDSFNKAMEGGKVDEIQGAIKKVDDLVETNFGIKNVMTEGFPQKFPFELKAPLQSMQQVAGTRAAGFRKYKRNPAHEGTQTLGGGENYREFLFSYKQPAGSPRAIEPEYKYAHDFNLDESDRMGGFVHMRTSDRTDEFGRRLLHIEEVQSDMHQKINMQQRALKKQNAEFERQGVTPEQAYEKMGTRKKKITEI